LDSFIRLELQYEAEQLMSRNFAAGVPADMACGQILTEHCIDPREPERGEAWLDMHPERSSLDKKQGFLAILHSRWHASMGEQVDFWINQAVEKSSF
jgi:hypothetical protein